MKSKKSQHNKQSFIKSWKKRLSLLKKTDSESGATFMEVLVTLAIVAVLMTTIGLAVIPFFSKSKVTVAQNNIKTIETALDAYLSMNFEYPDDSEWKTAVGPFLKGGVPDDPWGNEFIYQKPGPDERDYGLSSTGEDGIQGNEDDINSWEIK